MRDYGDRETPRERWDADVTCHPLDANLRQVRLVGPVQDIAMHWCIMKAGEFADKIRSLMKKSQKDRTPFVRPQDPPGVPFLCPKFDLYREKFIDYVDPSTGKGFQKKETLGMADLKRHGIKLSKSQAKDTEAKYSPDSVDAGKAITLEVVYCPQHHDFKQEAGKRTWWHAFIRPKKSARGRRSGPQEFAIVGKGGFPSTAMGQIRRIAKERKMAPSDPDNGYDLMMSMDKSQPAQQMYYVKEVRGEDSSPLTSEEKKEAFGLYKLAEKGEDGKNVKVDFLGLLRIRREDPARLKGMKVIREAGIWPLEDMARDATSAESMKEFMVSNGYYNGDGSPRKELIAIPKKKGDWDNKGDDKPKRSSSSSSRRPAREEDAAPRRRSSSRREEAPSKKPRSGKKRRSKISDD